MKKDEVKKIANRMATFIGLISAVLTIYPNVPEFIKVYTRAIVAICVVYLSYVFIVDKLQKIIILVAEKCIKEILKTNIEPKIKCLDVLPELKVKMDAIEQKVQNISDDNAALKTEFQLSHDTLQSKYCPIRLSSYVDDSVQVANELSDLIYNRRKDIKELRIICFGRNGFGGVIERIINRKINIAVKVIVFNAASHKDICRRDDPSRINNNIVDWLKDSKNVEVFVSEIPPMIRAAVVYAEDKSGNPYAIWGSVQSYRFAYNKVTKKISLEKPPHSLISICKSKETVEGDFRTLVNCFEEEFLHLEQESKKAKLTTDGRGKLVVGYE